MHKHLKFFGKFYKIAYERNHNLSVQTRFFVYLSLGLILSLSATGFVFVGSAGKNIGRFVNSQLPLWAVVLYHRKTELISSENNILFLGGSSVTFGIRAEEITRVTGRPSFNFGLQADMGLQSYFYIAKQLAKSGDTVVVIPEVMEVCCQSVFATHAWHMIGFGYFGSLPFLEKIDYLRHVDFPFIANALIDNPFVAAPAVEGYLGMSLSAYGDSDVADSMLLSNIIPADTFPRPDEPRHIKQPHPKFLKTLGEMAAWATDNNVSLFVTDPTQIALSSAFSYSESMTTMASIDGIKRLELPTGGFLPVSLMHDTAYHPSRQGSKLHSILVGAALCNHIADCPVTINQQAKLSLSTIENFHIRSKDISFKIDADGKQFARLKKQDMLVTYSATQACPASLQFTLLRAADFDSLEIKKTPDADDNIAEVKNDSLLANNQISINLPDYGNDLSVYITVKSENGSAPALDFSLLRIQNACETQARSH